MSIKKFEITRKSITCGVTCAFTAYAFGAEPALGWVLFLFGASYANLWIRHS